MAPEIKIKPNSKKIPTKTIKVTTGTNPPPWGNLNIEITQFPNKTTIKRTDRIVATIFFLLVHIKGNEPTLPKLKIRKVRADPPNKSRTIIHPTDKEIIQLKRRLRSQPNAHATINE